LIFLSVGRFGLALPEFAAGRAGSIAVVGGGAEGALFAAVPDEEEFEGDREEEEDADITVSFVFFPNSDTGKDENWRKKEGRRTKLTAPQ
jgi:hypothetical protein